MIDGKYYMPQVTPGKQGIVRSDDFTGCAMLYV
jgi:hypothetical protein